jgi:DNA-binding transcriptional LysR family regulator
MSPIETRLLHYFVMVAEERHFANAALRLGISPPTLTNQIQKLENRLGAKLLRRKGNTKVVITDAGQRFLTDAREALRQVEQATLRAQQAGRGELGRLELGCLARLTSVGLLRSWIGEFHQAHPAIEITVHPQASMPQIARIVRKELDAGFARRPHKYPSGVRGFEVYRQGMVLALPKDHPLARHKAIDPAMLAGEAFVSITPELDMGFSGHTAVVGRLGNFMPRVVKRHDGFIAVLSYVALGDGIAVVPELMRTADHSDVVFRDIAADPVPQTSIAFVYGSDPSPSAKLLIRHMQRHVLRNGGKGAAPRHNHHRIIIPSALNLDPHPEVLAKRASKDVGRGAGACTLRGSARSLSSGRPKAGPVGAEHLRATGMSQ